ncbi:MULTISPECIES: hypothetical protein [Metabacillus]|uniref:Glycine zipper-like domain-containing protein n=2 Tax=Metabacillus TaxID=2675233 RepID=A0A179SMQ5_9BACI|nr:MULTISPECIES: hypothetical protein [Metabacillus]OAS82751.1 hypothetical protein A6K24_11555 [Metabacillus litoralis]
MENHGDQVKAIIKELRNGVSKQIVTKLDLNKCERVIENLTSLSVGCEECQNHLLELKNHFEHLKTNVDQIEETDFKQHKQLINQIVSHPQKKHKLVPEGYYLGIYMSVGMSLGVVFGLTIFENIALGLPIGMCMGIAIGASLDADAKKKGKTF